MRSESIGSKTLASGAQLVPFSTSQGLFCYVVQNLPERLVIKGL
jgi:hypothetical protein